MSTSIGDLYNQMQSQWDAMPLQQRLQQLGYQQNMVNGAWNGAYTTQDPQSVQGQNIQGLLNSDNNSDTKWDTWANKTATFDPRSFVKQYGVLPLSAKYNGNIDYTDASVAAQGKGSLMDFLKYVGNGSGGQIVNDPTLGQVYVPDNPSTFDPYRNYIQNGDFVTKAFDNGAGVYGLAGAILGAGAADVFNGGANSFSNILGGTTPTDASWGVNPQLPSGLTAPDIPEVYPQAIDVGAGGSALNPSGSLLGSLTQTPSFSPTGVPNTGGGATPTNYLDTVDYTTPEGLSGTATNVPTSTGNPADYATLGGSSVGTSALAKLLGISDSAAQLLGAGGTTLAGLYGANQANNTLQNIFDQQRTDRAPALAAYNNALNNPDSWYTSAPAMGAADAAARALSVQGNPAWNPTLSAKLAANNLGGYNSYLNNLSGPAFGGQATQAALGTALAGTQNQAANAVAGGLGNLTTPTTDIATLLKQLQGLSGLGSTAASLNTGTGFA